MVGMRGISFAPMASIAEIPQRRSLKTLIVLASVAVLAVAFWPAGDANQTISVDFSDYIETFDNAPNLPWVTATASSDSNVWTAEGRTEELVLVVTACPEDSIVIEAQIPAIIGEPIVEDSIEVESCDDVDLMVSRDSQLLVNP